MPLPGGEKNRLMLAKILANPKTCLILDEPTNDLDMDTLDMLEEILSQYKGTLIVVSHDRDFLDQTVTRIMGFEGDGKIDICIGGYSDYIEKKRGSFQAKPKQQSKLKANNIIPKEEKKPLKKLTYKSERELSQLPKKIAGVEAIIATLSQRLSDSDFYQRDPDSFHETSKDLTEAQVKLERYETRWLELEEMKAKLH